MFRPAQLIALIAALQILGGHWVVVQSVAWLGMLVEYSQTGTLDEALSKTFDGKHPCKLCSAVQQGTAEEKAPTSVQTVAKWEAVLDKTNLAFEPDFYVLHWSIQHMRAPSRNETPVVPPPRA